MSTACFDEKHRHHQTHFSYFYGRFNCSIASDSFYSQTIKVIPERTSPGKVSGKFAYSDVRDDERSARLRW